MVGAGAKILGPFTVGDNSRIAANSVVLEEVPANSTAVGAPAKIVRREGKRIEPILDHIHIPDPVQQELEKRAFIAGGSDWSAPVTTVGGLMNGKLPDSFGKVRPSYIPSVKFAKPEEYLPDYVCDSLRLGIREMGKKICGFS